MKKTASKTELPKPVEEVKLTKPMDRRLFRIFAFFICFAVLVAAFAVSGIFATFSEPVQTFLDGIFRRERVTDRKNDGEPQIAEPLPEEQKSENAPSNAIPVVAQTLYEPSKVVLEAGEEGTFRFSKAPVVLLYCANSKEAYLPEGETIPEGKIGEMTFSEEPSQTVRAVAELLAQCLQANGISVFYKEPEAGNGYLGSSARAGELVRNALRENPDISLVIEIGRDSILDATGNYIKTAAGSGEPTAQVLAVVGSGESGISCPAWPENLELAKALECAAEKETPDIFRGVRVKSTPQNQQYAPHSLYLLIGSGANTAAEAGRAAVCIANAIASFLP